MEPITHSKASREVARRLKDGDSVNVAMNCAVSLLVAEGSSKYDATHIVCDVVERDFQKVN